MRRQPPDQTHADHSEDGPGLELLLPDIRAAGLDPPDPDRFDTEGLLASLDDALPSPPLLLLVVVALLSAAHLVMAAPWAVGADPFGLLAQSSDSHQVRDGAVGVVVAVAGLLTVWRPRWALPCFAISSVALVGQLIAGIIDNSIIQSGLAELIHATSVVLTTLIGLSAVRLAALGPSPRRRPGPPLRLVDRPDGAANRPPTRRRS